MTSSDKSPRQRFTEAARLAAAAARRAKQEDPDSFGRPELFVVTAEDQAFTWELRRFGGIVLARGPAIYPTAALARADGEAALAAMRANPDLPRFRKERRPEKDTGSRS